jgi:hypothetical protein
MPITNRVTIIDLDTGKATTSALRVIAKLINIPEDRLKRYRKDEVKVFKNYCIAFKSELVKQQGGNKHAFDNVNRKRGFIS